MTSTATIRRKTGGTTTDADGYKVPEWADVHVAISCRIGSDKGSSATRTVSTPGGDVQVATRTLSLPASTTNLADGDLVEVTAGELAGSVWRVVEADFADQQTARRCPVVATERPSEWT